MVSFRSLRQRSPRGRSLQIGRARKLRIERLENRLVLACPPTCLDFGDAPDSANGPAGGNPYPTLLEHDGARHGPGGPRLGAIVDAEDNGQPNATATGDDLAGFASVSSDFNTGNSVVITFTANQPGPAGNGITVFVTKSVQGNGVGPSINVAGNMINIDLNSNPSTPTTAQQLVGAINIDPNASPLMRAAIAQGNPITDIATPNINYSPLVLVGGPDEDGVSFPFPLVVSATAPGTGRITVNVQNAPGGAVLNAWMDFNQDGDWADLDEQIAISQTLAVGDNVVNFLIPTGALAGTTFARFRLSSLVAVLPPTGQAPDGEVEDYQVKLLPQVTLSAAPATITEVGGIATVTATLSAVSAQDVTINLGLTGTSVNNLDYRPSATEILITAGSTTGSITLTAQNDNLVEGNEQIVVDITAVSNAVEVGVQQQTVTIDDNNTATLSIAPATTVTEQGGAQNIRVTLTTTDGAGGTAILANSEFLLQVPPTGGNRVTGIADEDTFRINDGQGGGDVVFEFDKDGFTTAPSIVIGIADNSTQDEIADAIAFVIQNSGLGVTSTHLGGGVVRITGINHTLDTSGTLRLIQSGAPGVRLTADVDDLLTGTAVSDTDYVIFNTQGVTFTAGAGSSATQIVRLTPRDDTLVEGNESVNLVLHNLRPTLDGQASLGTTNGVVTITDADTATVAWQSASTTVGEDAATPNVTAVLTTAAGNTLENAAVFTVTATNASAENADYDSGAFPKTITFPAASGNGATQSTTFDPASDTLVEGDETVTLTLLVNSGVASLGAQTTHGVTITDADTATVAWQSATTTVGEDAATPNVTAVLTTAAGNTLENPAAFTVTATNGSAEDADYDSGAFPTKITFPAGSGSGAKQDTTFDPASDTLVEGDESLTLTLAINSGVATLGAQTVHAVTITDADTATVAWQSATTSVGEDDNSAPTVTAVLTTAIGNTLENDAIFTVTATNGSAENADYDNSVAFPVTLFFSNASSNGATQIVIFDQAQDRLVEGDETVTLALVVRSGAATLGAQATHVVTITDADSATVAWQSATATVGEDAATANVTAALTTAAGNTLENAAVFTVTATNGSAENTDYDRGTFPKTITFPAASGNGTTQNATFDPASDTLVEGDETVTLTLLVNSGVATLGAQTGHAVTITDADTATVAWQSATTTVGEDAVTPNVTAVLTTAAGNTLENAAVFNVTATNGSAENADYDSGAFPKTITFPAASGNGVAQNVTFDPASDTLVEGDETVTLTLLVNSGVATLGAQIAHGVTIADADLGLPVWRNPKNQFDVNDNTTTDPFDALVVINELNLNGSHVLPIPGVQPPFLDVNGDGFVSPVDALAIINDLNAAAPAPVPLPCDPSVTDLIVTGSQGNDRISIVPAPGGGVNVILNGTTSGPFSPAGRIVVCGRDGDDTITVDPNINRSTFLYGGAGNDVLDGGSGNDVLVGGEGNDQLYGGLGRNVLISGTSSNVPRNSTDSKRLLGGIGDNLMIAGFTDFDTLSVALAKILDEWSRLDADYTTRVNHLRGTLSGGLNGTIALNAATVHNNAVRDDLFGCTGQNWYLAHTAGPVPLDTILGQKATELLDTI